MNTSTLQEDWKILIRFLPREWKEKSLELGALVRKKKISSPEILLRVLLIHLSTGRSLRTTAAYAQEVGLCEINDAALLHRLKASGEWFRWMSVELMKDLKVYTMPDRLKSKYKLRVVDASIIKEPGSTGTNWRLHYCFLLNSLICDFFKITSPKEGESFRQFQVKEGDLLIGDRGYCHRKGLAYVLDQGGHALIRFHSTNLPLFTRKGTPYSVLKKFRTLNDGEVGDWDVWFESPVDKQLVKGRLISVRKSTDAIERAMKRLREYARKHSANIRPETKEHAEYVSLFTTVNRHNLKSKDLLTLYRGRWQIEMVFKRLKGVIGIGHLPKYNEESCIAWLYGKMLVAMLVERIYQEAEFFSPWGYPLFIARGQREKKRT